MLGAEAVIQSCLQEGITQVFVYTGEHIAPLLYALGKGKGLEYTVLTQGEHLGHMASGFVRAGGNLPLCLLPAGCPQVLSSIASCYHQNIPMVFVAGQVPSKTMGQDSPHETDLAGCCGNYLKASYLVTQGESIPKVMKEAFHLAKTGRMGPVVVEIPEDFQEQDLGSFLYPTKVNLAGYQPFGTESEYQMKRAVSLLARSKKSVMIVGQNVLAYQAQTQLQRFAEKYNLPVICTENAVGVLSSSHPLNMGVLGIGGFSRHFAMEKNDLTIVVGEPLEAYRSLEELQGLSDVLYLDVEDRYHKFSQVLSLTGDIKELLLELSRAVSPEEELLQHTTLQNLRQEEMLCAYAMTHGIHPANFFRLLGRKVQKDAMISVDSSWVQDWAGEFFFLKERILYLPTGKLASEGASLPRAIGAKLAQPQRQCFAILSDRGFQSSFGELSAIVAQNLDIKIIVLQYKVQGSSYEEQMERYEQATAVELTGSPDFLTLAHAYGFAAGRITQESEMDIALQYFLEEKGTQILLVDIPSDWKALSHCESAMSFEETGSRLKEETALSPEPTQEELP